MQILVVNAGSSSLKLRVLGDDDGVVATEDLPTVDPGHMGDEITTFLERNPDVDAVGHRVVHGGSLFWTPIVLDDSVDQTLADLAALAPLHNPRSLAAIAALRSLRPDLVQVACFDTSFHVTIPAKVATYAVPRLWRDDWGLRRYGFHGLSHEWASGRAAELLGLRASGLRLVTAHLGSGASLAAVHSGRSVDTTMGFTPMEGLVMATRSGSLDPGLILWAQRRGGLSADEVEEVLEHQSGLLGLSGVSGDLRQVLEAADAGDERSQLAYEVYFYRIQTGVAAMTVALGGLDGLVFTGGAGEASARLRSDVCAGLGFLGLDVEADANESRDADGIISPPGIDPAVLVVTAREDIEIARHVRTLLG